MSLLESIERYQFALESTIESLKLSFTQDVTYAVECIQKASRVFIVAKGTNTPAAISFRDQLIYKLHKNSFLVESPLLLEHLSSDDVVVLLSHSWSTHDAIVATRLARSKNATLVVITARPDQEWRIDSDIILEIFPKIEKIFSRPASPFSTYVLLEKIVSVYSKQSFDLEEYISAYTRGKHAEISPTLLSAEHVVILTSHSASPAAYHAALALSEGCAILAHSYDFDAYTHGWWVPHQVLSASPIVYLLLLHQQDNSLIQAYSHFKPFLLETNCTIIEWTTHNRPESGNIELMSRMVHYVLHRNQKTLYDMNEPPGKESIKKIYN